MSRMTWSRDIGLRSRAVIAVGALFGIALGVAAPSEVLADGPTVNGGGSSFAFLEIEQWRAEVKGSPFNLTLNYNAQGSSFGRSQYIAGAIDFAVSDIPFTVQEINELNKEQFRPKGYAYVPVSAGGLGFMYNLEDNSGSRVTNLNLTRSAVCRIFSEPNIKWNDAEIAGVNPGLALPDQLIRPIVRGDGSGTSYVFSEYCIAVAKPVWDKFVALAQGDANTDDDMKAGRPTSLWPKSFGVAQSAFAADGVAAAVADPAGLYSITYNEAGFAKQLGFPNASVQNAAGVFTQPTEEAVSIALGYASGRADGTFQLEYQGPDAKAYFPSTYSYVIAQTTGFPTDKGLVLSKFLCYAVTKGQRIDLTTELGYARLSAPLVEIAKNAIAKIPGAPPWDQCKVDSAPPPPAAPTATTQPITATTQPAAGTATTQPPAAGTATTAPPAVGGQSPSAATPAGGTTAAGTPATTPAGGTAANGSPVTVAAGSTTGGATTAGATTGGATTGGATPAGGATGAGTATGGGAGTPTVAGGSVASGGSGQTQTQISIDPVTGESVVVEVPIPVSESGCNDPVTGLPADPVTCAGTQPGFVIVAGDGAAVANPVAAPVAAPAKVNPIVGDSSAGPKATQIAWWLAQGASVCAIGVSLAGARRRAI